jgi:hypothetical protein
MMTPTIHSRVHARRDLDAMRAARDLDGLANALNTEGLLTRQPRVITWRAVTTKCPSGEAIRTKMEAAAPQSAAIRSAMEFLAQSDGLDIGDLDTWAKIDGMVAAMVLTVAEGQELKDLSMKPCIVTRLDVEEAIFNPNGSEK